MRPFLSFHTASVESSRSLHTINRLKSTYVTKEYLEISTLMNSIKIVLLSLTSILCSCLVDKDSFCNQIDLDKNETVEEFLKSIKNDEKIPTILSNRSKMKAG